MRTDFMPSAKQIAWRKKFAKMAKAGKFRKKKLRDPTKGSAFRKTTDRYEELVRQDAKEFQRRMALKSKKPKTKNTQKLKKEMKY